MPRLATAKHPEFARRNSLIIQGYDGGVHRTALAEKFHLSYVRIAQIIQEYRGKLRTFARLSWHRERRIIKLWLAGFKTREIAKQTSVHPRTVRRVARRNNLRPRRDRTVH